ncbi:MAG: HAD-IIB family hydrolase [Mycoplasmoidaceae bacterium]
MYKIAFIDLDGTLLRNGKRITKFAMQELIKYAKKNGHIILNSGRWHPSVSKFADKINEFVPNAVPYYASYNGAYLWDTKNKKFIYSNSLSSSMFYKSMMISKKFNLVSLIYTNKNNSIYSNNLKFRYLFEKYLNKKIIKSNSLKYEGEKINKILFVSLYKKKIKKLYSFLKDNFDSYYNICSTNKWAIEVNALNSNKGAVVEDVLKLLNLDYFDSISFGDSFNDLDMFKKTCFKVGFKLKKNELLSNVTISAASNKRFGEIFTKYSNDFSFNQNNIIIDTSLINYENISDFKNIIYILKCELKKNIILISNKDYDQMNKINFETGNHADLIIHNSYFTNNKVLFYIPIKQILKENELILYYTNNKNVYYDSKIDNKIIEKIIREKILLTKKEISKINFISKISKIVSQEKYYLKKINNDYEISYFGKSLNNITQYRILKNVLLKRKITPNNSVGFFTKLIKFNFPKEIFCLSNNFVLNLEHFILKINK